MRVLITGGCGFLGCNVGAAFLADGADVTVADALFRQGADRNLAWLQAQARPGRFAFHRIDVADADAVRTLFRTGGPFDYVCHLAGQVAMTTSLADPRRDLLTNVVGTFNVLEAVRGLSPSALVAYSSTNKVYGDLTGLRREEAATRYVLPDFPDGLDERTPLDFASPYGCSKGAADQYVRDWHRNYGLKTVVFRHSSIYGGRQFATADQGWIGWFCQKAVEQDAARRQRQPVPSFTISGTGKQVRDVLHADDLVRLYRAAYEHRDAVAGEIFNIGGGMGNSLSLIELFAQLDGLLDAPAGGGLRYERLPRRQSDQDVFVADIRKAERLMDWKPRVAAGEGLRRMLSWTAERLRAE